MLERIIRRLQASSLADTVIVATSMAAEDDSVDRLGHDTGALVFRGSESDVLDRYYQCARTYDLDQIVRATGDNPFVDPEACDSLIQMFIDQSLDYASAFPEFGSGFPIGIGVEIFTIAALERSWADGQAPHHREHVNEFIHENPDLFRQGVLHALPDKHAPTQSFTVDTHDQFAWAESLVHLWRNTGNDGEPSTKWLINNWHHRDSRSAS